jgi:hypothetical protein
MINEIGEIHAKLYNTHGKQLVDLAALRVIGGMLLSCYATYYEKDTSESLALLYELIDTRAASLGNINVAVKHVVQAANTVAYIESIPTDCALLRQEKDRLLKETIMPVAKAK